MLELPIDIEDLERFNDINECNPDKDADEEGEVIVKKGIIQKSNDGMARLSGYRHEEVIDTIFASFFHLDDIPLVESICDLAKVADIEEPSRVVRLIGKNGKPIPVQISVGDCGKDRFPSHRIKICSL